MKIVRFLGGLGNQMFQYAFYLALKNHGYKVKADITGFETYNLHNGFELNNIFKCQLELASQFEINILDPSNRKWIYRKIRRIMLIKDSYFVEKELFKFNAKILKDKSPKLYWGYWQHHQYLEGIEDHLRQEFKFPENYSNENIALLAQLEELDSSVAIHVRRGDYINNPFLGGIATLDYFKKALSIIYEKVKNPKFIVFSDDINWCKHHLQLHNPIYVDWNKRDSSFRDMELISKCKHAIISNSSFSWWAAWLNTYKNKIIIVPKIWYKSPDVNVTEEIHPKEWIKI